MPYYTKEKMLTKEMIFKYFEEDQELLQYLPSEPKLKSIPRELLLSIMANVRRAKYAEIYSKYKEIKSQKSTIGNKIYCAQITNEFKEGLNNFRPINL